MNDDRGSGIEVAPAIGISYSVQVGDGRSVVLQTHIPQTLTLEETNKLVDKLRQMADRQVQFGKVEAMEHEMELGDRTIRQLQDGIEAVDKKVASLQRTGAVLSGGRGPHQNGGKAAAKDEEVARKNAVVGLLHAQKVRAEIENKRDDLLKTLG